MGNFQLHYFLGVKVVQKSFKEVWIGQETYTKCTLEIFGVESSKADNKMTDPVTKMTKGTEDSQRVDKVKY